MRDYNAIQFRSPSDKQKQQQQQVMTSTTTATTLPYSPGLISTVRSTSLSPIPRVNHHTSHHNNNNNNNKMMTANVGSPSGGGNYSGITSTTVMTSSSSIMQSNNNNNADDVDAIRLPYLHNDDNDNKKSRQQQQQSSSMASTNVMTSTTMIKPRMNPVVAASSSSSSSAASPPQRTSHKSYRTTSASTDNAMSLSPTPYHTTTNTTGSKQNSAIHPQQQQQQQQQTNATVLSMTNIPPNGVNGSNASVTSNSSTQQQQQPQPPNLVLSPTDALALRRDYNNNFELYIHKLRTDLEQQQQMIQKISSASSKSDAVILELRSTIRQYKRQLEKLQQSTQSTTTTTTVDKSVPATTTTNTTDGGSSSNNNNKVDTSFQSNTDPIMMLSSDSTTMIQNHPIVLTLTEQLHELQNKLLTADLIRKELEDTIEAEQYTWELRVQDLEREVQELKQQSHTQQQSQSVAVISTTTPKVSTPQNTTTSRSLDTVPSNNNNDSTNDTNNNNNNNVSEEYRKQLEDAQNEIQRYRTIIMTTTTTSDMDDETMMNHNNSSMNTDVSASNNNNNNILIWKEKVILLEQERMELQGCLDEALKELEAVDLELQQEDTTNTLREENERLQNIIQELQQQQQRGLVQLDNSTNDVAAVKEQLQHLYRWLLERDGSEESLQLIRKMNQQYETVDELINAIQEHIDQNCTSIHHVQELERQISVHKGDIHAKEEESNEIRNSLKEAVSLLRPIQDSLAKLEKEKGKYQESLEGLQSQQDNNVLEIRKYKQLINDKDDEIDQMKQNIESLEIQLSKAKLAVANTVAAQHNLGNGTSRSIMMMDFNNNNNNDISTSSPSDALDEKRAKRRTGENNLKELLRDAQLRGDTSDGGDALEREQQQLRTIQEYEQEISLLRDELAKNDATIQRLQNSLTSANDELLELKQQQQQMNANSDGADYEAAKMQLQQAELRVQNLEEELQDTKRALASKRDAERSLNKSLKDALGLIKPLQIHLEESEMEKRQMEHELESLMKQQQQHRNNSVSRSLPNGSIEIANAVSIEVVKELETSVRQLEKENAMLHDALEDMSQSLNASHISGASPSSNRILSSKHHPTNNNANNSITNHESTRLHQEFVELQSRYEVTQTRLEDAYHENHTLSELVQQEQDEKYILHDEVATLREQLLLQQRQAGSGTATKSSVSIK